MSDGSTFYGAQGNASGPFFANVDLDGAYLGGSSSDAKIVPHTTNYTLKPEMASHIHRVDAALTVTCPANMPVGYTIAFAQSGSGQATFVAGAGAVVGNRGGATKTAGIYGVASLLVISNVGGNAAVYILSGDVA